MLLLGTQILDWPWLLLLAAAGLATGYVRLRNQTLSRYRVAQIVDRRLDLSDSLSTAWFLMEDPGRNDDVLAQAQIRLADEKVEKVDNAIVFPFVWKRTWAVAAALAAIAFGLFALRYLVTSSLDLSRPLIALPFSSLAEVFERIERVVQFEGTPKQAIRGEPRGLGHGPGPEENGEPGSSEDRIKQASSKPGDAAAKERLQRSGASSSNNMDSASPEQSREGSQRANDTGLKRDGSEDAGQHSPADRPVAKEERNSEVHQPPSGLLDRMKDALSGLMAKVRPQNEGPKTAERQSGQQDSKPGEQSAENNARNEQMPQEARNSQENQGGARKQSAQTQSGAEALEKSPATQGRSSDDSANRKGSDAHSGIGRQDGEKGLKEADQLRAMGKLDEIFGKRSANLTGDVTVETQSSNQRLQTQYSGRVARHSDLGGEIDRDQVPLALQKYVREYMEQVRKQANDQR